MTNEVKNILSINDEALLKAWEKKNAVVIRAYIFEFGRVKVLDKLQKTKGLKNSYELTEFLNNNQLQQELFQDGDTEHRINVNTTTGKIDGKPEV